MGIKDLFTTYWSQVTLLLLAISYFIKRILDIKSKKIEINHSLFQQNRLNTVNNFFSNYAKVELMWNHIEIYDILSNKFAVKEIDNYIFTPINELNKTLLELKIYFSIDDHKHFEELTKGLMSINGKLSNLFFESGKELSLTIKVNDFAYFKEDALSKNNKIMNELCLIIKDTFKAY